MKVGGGFIVRWGRGQGVQVVTGPEPLVLPRSSVSEMVIESVSVQPALMRGCRPKI